MGNVIKCVLLILIGLEKVTSQELLGMSRFHPMPLIQIPGNAKDI
jgi:hypothetical protein